MSRLCNPSWCIAALLAATAFAVLALAGPAPAAAADGGDAGGASRSIHVPPGWEGAYDFGYAPVVRVGDRVIVSGIPAGDDGTYEEKIRRMYERAEELLASAGAEIDDVVELTTFHARPKDSAAFWEEFELYMPIHRQFFGEHRPAWTAVGGIVLLSPSAPVEMRLVAVVGSGESSRVVRGGQEAQEPQEGGPDDSSPAGEEPEEPAAGSPR